MSVELLPRTGTQVRVSLIVVGTDRVTGRKAEAAVGASGSMALGEEVGFGQDLVSLQFSQDGMWSRFVAGVEGSLGVLSSTASVVGPDGGDSKTVTRTVPRVGVEFGLESSNVSWGGRFRLSGLAGVDAGAHGAPYVGTRLSVLAADPLKERSHGLGAYMQFDRDLKGGLVGEDGRVSFGLQGNF